MMKVNNKNRWVEWKTERKKERKIKRKTYFVFKCSVLYKNVNDSYEW